jgi:hypothetical protein
MELQTIQNRIHELRGQRVMLDYDLAELYEVETRVLKQAVKRNVDRFPHDFMFQLTNDEIDHMVSQNVIPSKSHLGGASPFAFSEQGVAMLSTVLKSKKAVMVNIVSIRPSPYCSLSRLWLILPHEREKIYRNRNAPGV